MPDAVVEVVFFAVMAAGFIAVALQFGRRSPRR
jgi:hypothetical protein